MSDLSPLCAQKRKLNVTTIWTALAICCLALIHCCGVPGLIIGSVQPKCLTQMVPHLATAVL
jgi:hypothetical protein